jgi:hypothetical protein
MIRSAAVSRSVAKTAFVSIRNVCRFVAPGVLLE